MKTELPKLRRSKFDDPRFSAATVVAVVHALPVIVLQPTGAGVLGWLWLSLSLLWLGSLWLGWGWRPARSSWAWGMLAGWAVVCLSLTPVSPIFAAVLGPPVAFAAAGRVFQKQGRTRLAFAPGPPVRGERFQFSLQYLLFVTLAVALVLGSWLPKQPNVPWFPSDPRHEIRLIASACWMPLALQYILTTLWALTKRRPTIVLPLLLLTPLLLLNALAPAALAPSIFYQDMLYQAGLVISVPCGLLHGASVLVLRAAGLQMTLGRPPVGRPPMHRSHVDRPAAVDDQPPVASAADTGQAEGKS